MEKVFFRDLYDWTIYHEEFKISKIDLEMSESEIISVYNEIDANTKAISDQIKNLRREYEKFK